MKKLAVPSVAFALLALGCGDAAKSQARQDSAFKLVSPAFTEGGTIPDKHARDAEDVSPALSWTGAPARTWQFALICDDPDAPGKTWVHWVLYHIPPDRTDLPEKAAGIGTEGINDFKKIGYGGPKPPKGHGVHHYRFKLYALDTDLSLKAGITKAELTAAMKGHILSETRLIGTYERKK